jgi:hypothetical protein
VKVWAGMATIDGREGCRAMAVDSIVPQVDRLTIADGNRRGDQAKFLACEHAPAGIVFASVDDDLIYPADYIATLLDGLKRHPGCIVSFHGWTMDENGEMVDNYRCLENVWDDVEVHVAGTGVMAFHIDTIRPLMADFESVNADVWLSLRAEERGIKRVVLAHRSYWLGYSQMPATETNERGESVPRSIYTHTAFKTGSAMDGSAGKARAVARLAELIHG